MSLKQIIRRGSKLFSDKKSVDSLHQAIALNFYPERAHFTTTHNEGDEFADHLMTSYPVMMQRDLSNQVGGMLRRGDWFRVTTEGEDPGDHRSRRWLQWVSEVQRKAMYNRRSLFTRSTKEGDKDFTAFGQCAMSAEWIPGHGLLYRTWHLRDIAWVENEFGQIDEFHRNWEPTAQDLVNKFGKDALSTNAARAFDKDPLTKIKCRHIVMPSKNWLGEKDYKEPFVSLHIELEGNRPLEEVGLNNSFYFAPRWQTASGSQYAHSPATIVGLADARLIQDMHRVLLDAGEMAVRPPLVASREAIRGDVSLYAGGVTWVEAAFDRDPREAITPMITDKQGIPAGMEMADRAQGLLAEIFYLNKLTLPMTQGMTAYEASQRVQEYIRAALPIFEPMEIEYNGGMCDITFDILMRAGYFGTPSEIPAGLRGTEVNFQFESPLRDAEGQEKLVKFQEAMGIIGQSVQVDRGSIANIDMNASMRGALQGAGVPEEWIVDGKQVEADQKKMAAMAIAAQQGDVAA